MFFWIPLAAPYEKRDPKLTKSLLNTIAENPPREFD